MLEVKHLTKIFNKKDAHTKTVTQVGVKDISFVAQPGRICGFIGANGAGKTSTMRMLAGLTQPDSGQISLYGQPYKNLKDLKKKISFVSAETQIFDRLTPHEILSFYGQLADIPQKELEKNIDELAEKLEMKTFLDTRCAQFSTGMKQKVSLARGLITQPSVLIFDEVTNGLDIFASQALKDIIKELKADHRIIMYSTHTMPDADELCDDVAVIHEGMIKAVGAVSELHKKYHTTKIHDLFFKIIQPS